MPEGLYHKYFVLEPEDDPAAEAALVTYMEMTDDEQLAEDLEEWLGEIRR